MFVILSELVLPSQPAILLALPLQIMLSLVNTLGIHFPLWISSLSSEYYTKIVVKEITEVLLVQHKPEIP